MTKLIQFRETNLVLGISRLEKDKKPVHNEYLVYNENAFDSVESSSKKEYPTAINITAICDFYQKTKVENPDAQVRIYVIGFVDKLPKDYLDKIRGESGSKES